MTERFLNFYSPYFKLYSGNSRIDKKGRAFKLKGELKRWTAVSVCAFAAFTALTVLLLFVDVRPIGANGGEVGFATLNGRFYGITGVNMLLYTVTDWLGLVPIAVALGFAVLGLCQLMRRKSLLKVDISLLLLGGFYIAVIASFFLFENAVVNYRPILINGISEPSYPSSTTLLFTCVMPTALLQLNGRIKNKRLKHSVFAVITAFTVFTVVGRLLSGVHWLTDIIGGALLSLALVSAYAAAVLYCEALRTGRGKTA